MAQGVKVDLPQAKALNEDKPPIAVSFARDGKAYVGKTAVDATQLLPAIEREASGDRTRRVEIRGDKALAYGRVIEAMGEISAAGYGRIALVSEPPGGQ
ncbi:ExbD/TolR family protein [Burkholderia cepacia]|uniref:ExbD/TolR family protein n=1 Tax=Burkholderia cepacia TaxID=292 RepID=UPI002AB7640C|nr:biopolymer transporter ExbD [Burkholderia cepacia]